MRLLLFIGLFFLIAFTPSCKKEIPFPDGFAGSTLVVSSLFGPEIPLEVYVGNSYSVNDSISDDNFVSDAQVQLKDEQGNLIAELVHNGGGVYRGSGININHETIYRIDVEASGLPKASAKNKVPKAFTCSYIGEEEKLFDNRTVWAFELEIEDNPDEENYYILEGYFDIPGGHDQWGESEVNGYIEPHTGHFTNDPNAENASILSGTDFEIYPLRAIYLRDENFNGETYRTVLGLRDTDLYFNPNTDGVTANIFVKSVSKEMYDYYTSLERYRLSSGNIFAQPEVVTTNVKDGLGIFGGYTMQTFEVDLPKSGYIFPSDISIENSGCTSPCPVKFTTDGGALMNYNWDFGDGNTSTEPNPEHTYLLPGTYNVNVDVTSSASTGDSSGWSFEVTVN